MIQQADYVLPHLRSIFAHLVRFVAFTMTTTIQSNDAVACIIKRCNRSRHFPILRSGVRKTVDQHHGHALPFIEVMNLDAVGIKECSCSLPAMAVRGSDNKASQKE